MLLFIGSGGLARVEGIVVLIGVGIITLTLSFGRRRSEFQPGGRPRKRKRRQGTSRQPFRSPVLGWATKVVGLSCVLLIAMFSDRWADLSQVGLLGWLLYLPGIGLMILGYRLCLRTFEPGRHPDPRPPVLYLRAFDDDGQGSFQPSSWLAKLHGIFRYRDLAKSALVFVIHPVKILRIFLNAETYSAEELLAEAFRRCGPLVAIGQPGERLATAGADRMYVPDEIWQKVVLDTIAWSHAVILQPSHTRGVRWEMERVFDLVPKPKLMLSLLNFKAHPNRYEDFRAWLRDEQGLDLPVGLPFLDEPTCLYFEADGTPRFQRIIYRSPLAWSFVGNAVDVRKTFDTFIRGTYGTPRDLPQVPRKQKVAAALSVPLALAVAFGFVTVWIAIVRGLVALPVVAPKPATTTVSSGRSIPDEFAAGSDGKSRDSGGPVR